MPTPQPLSLSIEGMHCGGCVNRVTMALSKTPGVTIERVDVGSASIAYDPAQTSQQAIIEAIKGLGFTARAGG